MISAEMPVPLLFNLRPYVRPTTLIIVRPPTMHAFVLAQALFWDMENVKHVA